MKILNLSFSTFVLFKGFRERIYGRNAVYKEGVTMMMEGCVTDNVLGGKEATPCAREQWAGNGWRRSAAEWSEGGGLMAVR